MGTRLSDEQMPRMFQAPHADVPLGFYTHSKTGRGYLVIGGSFSATPEEGEIMVHYMHREQGYLAHRTVPDFLATVGYDSRNGPVSRFQRDGVPLAPILTFLHFLRIVLAHPLAVVGPPG